jgi:hypothetical protein
VFFQLAGSQRTDSTKLPCCITFSTGPGNSVFGTNHAKESGHKIWNLECQEPLELDGLKNVKRAVQLHATDVLGKEEL